MLPKDVKFEHGPPNLLLALGAVEPRYAPAAERLSRKTYAFQDKQNAMSGSTPDV